MTLDAQDSSTSLGRLNTPSLSDDRRLSGSLNLSRCSCDSQTAADSPRSPDSLSASRLDVPDYPNALRQQHGAEAGMDTHEGSGEPIVSTNTHTSLASIASRLPDFEVIFEDGDPENPQNWSLLYRSWIIFCVSYSTWVIIMYSTSYTATVPGLMQDFGVSKTTVTLGLTTYLLGLASGALVLAPMSELYGRRIIYLVCVVIWAALIIPCGLASSLTSIIIVRYFGALFGAALVSNGPGSVVDVSNPEYLAFAMSLWSVAPINGPVTGPLIGGFVYESLGWRWTNWIALILGVGAVVSLFTVKETYAPLILKRKAARLRKTHDDPRFWCQYDQKKSSLELIKINLSRPFVLFATEPILWFMNLWISLVYGILYLCFIAYPVVFMEYREWGPGTSTLGFIGIGIGTVMASVGEPILRKVINTQPLDPKTGRPQPEASALVMAIGAILTPLGQLGFSWTCVPTTIHWAIPIAFGIPFGAGNTISFIYSSNYLAAAYGIYAASALAGNAVLRSIAGGVLPLGGPRLYEALSPQWAGTLLGLLEVAMIPIPFVFWRYGAKIRAKSRIIRILQEDEEQVNAKREKAQTKREHRNRGHHSHDEILEENAGQHCSAETRETCEEKV